ncbi:MAG: NYN domain-containing protein [Actinomycetota bacterium]
MRVGVYVDGFNLFYGGRGLCGRSVPGWRWLDIRKLSQQLIENQSGWNDSEVSRVVFCTARISGSLNQDGQKRQDVYLRALTRFQSVDEVSLGNYVFRTTKAPLALPDRHGRPLLTRPRWPIMIKEERGPIRPDTIFMASVARREEKGSDVNVASHLLIDTMDDRIDAALVVSNDSDLAYPLREMRKRIPVAVINPTSKQTAGKLKGLPYEGVGRHWWYQLKISDFIDAQLPDQIGKLTKPANW